MFDLETRGDHTEQHFYYQLVKNSDGMAAVTGRPRRARLSVSEIQSSQKKKKKQFIFRSFRVTSSFSKIQQTRST